MRRAARIRVALVTNVPDSILQRHFAGLLARDDLAELTVIRDRPGPALGAPVRYTLPRRPPRWGDAERVGTRVLRLWREVRAARPDVLMVMHWFPDGYYVLPIGRLLGIPVVAHIIGGAAELTDGCRRVALSRLPRGVKRAAERITRALMRRSAVLTFTGCHTSAWFARAGVAGPERVVLRAVVQPDEALTPAADREYDVAYVGRIDADKRFDRFLRAIAHAAAARRGLRVAVVGVTEADAARLPEYAAAKAAAGDGLLFLGRRANDEVQTVLRRAKVFVLSSDSEGRSLAMVEAMGRGAVPVVTAVGDLTEVIEHSGSGFAIPLAGDGDATAGALAGAVVRLLGDDALRARMAAAGHRWVMREHSLRASGEDWLRILAAAGLACAAAARTGGEAEPEPEPAYA